MSIYVIADPHLSLSEGVEKPMDVFGGEWVNHTQRLKENWEAVVKEEDTVIIAGDVSWALKLEEAMADLSFFHSLSGQKVFVKGNHDLWWTSIAKLSTLFGDGMFFLQNNYFSAEGRAICGSRGWICPGGDEFTEHDEKIYKREILRLRASLSAARKDGFERIIGVLHFPPTGDRLMASGFTDLFEEYRVEHVYYGHLHGPENFGRCLQGERNGVEYKLVSLDYLRCMPLKVED